MRSLKHFREMGRKCSRFHAKSLTHFRIRHFDGVMACSTVYASISIIFGSTTFLELLIFDFFFANFIRLSASSGVSSTFFLADTAILFFFKGGTCCFPFFRFRTIGILGVSSIGTRSIHAIISLVEDVVTNSDPPGDEDVVRDPEPNPSSFSSVESASA